MYLQKVLALSKNKRVKLHLLSFWAKKGERSESFVVEESP